MNAIVGDGTT